MKSDYNLNLSNMQTTTNPNPKPCSFSPQTSSKTFPSNIQLPKLFPTITKQKATDDDRLMEKSESNHYNFSKQVSKTIEQIDSQILSLQIARAIKQYKGKRTSLNHNLGESESMESVSQPVVCYVQGFRVPLIINQNEHDQNYVATKTQRGFNIIKQAHHPHHERIVTTTLLDQHHYSSSDLDSESLSTEADSETSTTWSEEEEEEEEDDDDDEDEDEAESDDDSSYGTARSHDQETKSHAPPRRTMKDKLGLIFHHHHNDHHRDRDHKWKLLKMTRHHGNIKRRTSTARKHPPRSGVAAAVVKHGGGRDGDGDGVGHFRALVEGLMRHVRGGGRRKAAAAAGVIGGGKRRMGWWGGGGVKMGNYGRRRGRVKVGFNKKFIQPPKLKM